MHTFEIADLNAYLTRHVAGFEGLESTDKFKDGQSNPTYLLNAESGQYVLRAKPLGKLLKSAHAVDREYRVMTALADTAVPVPVTHHLSADPEGADNPLGAQFFVMDYVPGRILWDPAFPDMAKDNRRPMFDAMAKTLAALHDVNLEATGLTDYGRPGNYFERQIDRWTRQYVAAEIDKHESMDRLMAWLADNCVADDGTVALVHGDYRLDNMIFDAEAPQVRAVLDWELSTLGHPLADLAYQCMQWRLPTFGTASGLGHVDRVAEGLPTEQEYVAQYCALRGIGNIDNWSFYLAFSFFRLAAIIQGVVKRAADGNASNPSAVEAMRKAVPSLAMNALHVLETES